MRTAPAPLLPVLVAVFVATALASCGDAAGDTPSGSTSGTAGPGSAPAPTGRLTVYAAASLTGPFTALADEFEAAHDGVHVQIQFAGSADLLTQLEGGAPADVLASADTPTMDKAVAAGLVAGEPVDFATNTLVVAVAPGNPLGITGLADLADPGIVTVVCAPQVPCGAATARATEAAGVTIAPASETTAVTDVLAAVTSGEADAGIVYVTDAAAAGEEVEAVDFPEAAAAVNTYPITVLDDAAEPALAASFVEFVTGPDGRAVLGAAGFGAP